MDHTRDRICPAPVTRQAGRQIDLIYLITCYIIDMSVDCRGSVTV